jgi:hypothetical protein
MESELMEITDRKFDFIFCRSYPHFSKQCVTCYRNITRYKKNRFVPICFLDRLENSRAATCFKYRGKP